MSRLLLVIIILTIATNLMGFEGTLEELDWRGKELAQFEPGQTDEDLPFSSSEVRSPARALLYSLAIPGAGQYYCKSYIKGAVMTLAEIAFWGMYFYFESKGDDKTEEYEDFADEHWSEELYKEWLSIADTSEHPPVEHLPEEKTQQYYEMIGKYYWFLTGWDDYEGDRNDPDPSHLLGQTTPHREQYLQMRADANSFYTTAKYFIGASIFNHVVSALEAAWYANHKNEQLYEKFSRIKVRSRVAMIDGNPTPKVELEVKF